MLRLYFLQLIRHGKHGFLLGGLVVKGNSVHLSLVHLPYPVAPGCSFFNLHCIILLKNEYKNNTQTDFLVDWMLPKVIQSV